MKELHIKFNEEGIVVMFSEKLRPYHIKTDIYPQDFRQNPNYYQLKIDKGEIVGLKLRDDLEEYKKQQELINIGL